MTPNVNGRHFDLNANSRRFACIISIIDIRFLFVDVFACYRKTTKTAHRSERFVRAITLKYSNLKMKAFPLHTYNLIIGVGFPFAISMIIMIRFMYGRHSKTLREKRLIRNLYK